MAGNKSRMNQRNIQAIFMPFFKKAGIASEQR